MIARSAGVQVGPRHMAHSCPVIDDFAKDAHDVNAVERAARWADNHPTGRAKSITAALDAEFGVGRPPIVVLCGSTRFYAEFQEENYRLTMEGAIVLSVGFYPHARAEHGHGEGVGHGCDEKVALDELHKRKIDLADRVHVLNVDGYIGESTRSEIAYASAMGKPITYLEVT